MIPNSPSHGRNTDPGDTIASSSAERHYVTEAALEQSRRVVVFVSNAASHGDAAEKMKKPFDRAYKDSIWKVRRLH